MRDIDGLIEARSETIVDVSLSFSFTYIFLQRRSKLKKWGAIQLIAEAVTGIASVISIVAGFKNDEDLDERVRRILDDDSEEEE